MYSIQANPSGTRSIAVSDENLQTIGKYGLLRHLVDSNGIVDETVLDKLKLNVRSLIAAQEEDCRDLLDLCIDVIYHRNMKAFGLQQLVKLYQEAVERGWLTADSEAESASPEPGAPGPGPDEEQEQDEEGHSQAQSDTEAEEGPQP